MLILTLPLILLVFALPFLSARCCAPYFHRCKGSP